MDSTDHTREKRLAKSDIVAGLDIGTTKICCVVAELGESGEVIVSGIGVSPSHGIMSGVVVDIETTSRAIEEAVEKASRQSGQHIGSVYVGVTGKHIASLNSPGVTAITHSDREINEDDVERVHEQARVIVIPPDREILAAIPRTYSIDGQSGIKHPVGMSGSRLEVEMHIITAARTFLDNVRKCVNNAGLEIDDMVLESQATAETVLLPAEKNLGACLVDIGGGTSDIAIFKDGEIYYSRAIDIAGERVTQDMAYGLQVTADIAEDLKIKYGCTDVDSVSETETVPVIQIGKDEPRQLPRRILSVMIEPRMEELFEYVLKEIEKSGCKGQMPAGMVLSGGGSQLPGTLELASRVLGMPVRQGKPTGISGLSDVVNSPIYSTAVGLVQYGVRKQLSNSRDNAGYGLWETIKRWYTRLFNKMRTG